MKDAEVVVGDVAQHLETDMHQIPGREVFVAVDESAGGPVQMGQPGEVYCAAEFDARWRGSDCGRPGPIGHLGSSLIAVAVGPSFGSGISDSEPFGGPPQRPPIIDDTTSQPQPGQLRQRRNDETRRPPKVMCSLGSSHSTRRSSACQLAAPLPTF